jgi:hypothetical protein
MHYRTFRYSFAELNINAFQVEKILGYNDQETREMISRTASEIFGECAFISDARAEYRIYDNIGLLDSERSLKINEHIFNIRKIVFGQMKRTESVAAFLCTAGREIGNRSRRLMKEGDLLKGYIYDVIGNAIVEATADRMQEVLKNELRLAGKKITNRFSPGYCGWDVAEQHKLFSLLPDNFCGIRLTESALMDPVKSVSGFIGIGTEVKFNPYPCELCDRVSCLYRKTNPGK